MRRPGSGGWGLLWVGAEGGTYHSHLLFEVIQVPAVFGALALLGRALVIFLVLRGGDTIAVRATRLRARRGYKGTPALRLRSCVSGQGLALGAQSVSALRLWVSLRTPESHLFLLASPSLAPCTSGSLSLRVSIWVCLCLSLSLCRSLPFSLHVSFYLSVSSSPSPWALSLSLASLSVSRYVCLSLLIYLSRSLFAPLCLILFCLCLLVPLYLSFSSCVCISVSLWLLL